MRILVADDHDLVRETIAIYLNSEGMDEVVAVQNLEAAVDAAHKSGSFDLVLLDYNMPGMEGLAGLRRMKSANDDRPVAILSGSAPQAIANEAISAGAAGFVPKTLGAKSMISAINFMAAGEIYLPFDFMQKSASDTVGDLTERETQVLRGLCKGQSNKDIARDYDLQEVTIKLHVKTLCRKLGARNRTQAAIMAKERELV